PCLHITIFLQSGLSGHFKRLGYRFLKIFRSWGSTTSKLLYITTQVLLPCASRSKKWAKQQRRRYCNGSKTTNLGCPRSQLNPNWSFEIQPVQQQLSAPLHVMLLSQRTMRSLRQPPGLRTQQERRATMASLPSEWRRAKQKLSAVQWPGS